MLCEIIDYYFNIFFDEIYTVQIKKNKVLFGYQSLGAQTGILVSQTTWTFAYRLAKFVGLHVFTFIHPK